MGLFVVYNQEKRVFLLGPFTCDEMLLIASRHSFDISTPEEHGCQGNLQQLLLLHLSFSNLSHTPQLFVSFSVKNGITSHTQDRDFIGRKNVYWHTFFKFLKNIILTGKFESFLCFSTSSSPCVSQQIFFS